MSEYKEPQDVPLSLFNVEALAKLTGAPQDVINYYMSIFTPSSAQSSDRPAKRGISYYSLPLMFQRLHKLEKIFREEIIPLAFALNYSGINDLIIYFIGLEVIGTMSAVAPVEIFTYFEPNTRSHQLDDNDLRKLISLFGNEDPEQLDASLIINFSEWLLKNISEILHFLNNNSQEQISKIVLDDIESVRYAIYFRKIHYLAMEYMNNLPNRICTFREDRNQYKKWYQAIRKRRQPKPKTLRNCYYKWNPNEQVFCEQPIIVQPEAPSFGRYYKFYTDERGKFMINN